MVCIIHQEKVFLYMTRDAPRDSREPGFPGNFLKSRDIFPGKFLEKFPGSREIDLFCHFMLKIGKTNQITLSKILWRVFEGNFPLI